MNYLEQAHLYARLSKTFWPTNGYNCPGTARLLGVVPVGAIAAAVPAFRYAEAHQSFIENVPVRPS